MLAVRDLGKIFHITTGSPVVALDSISLSAKAGDCVCLLGANGSGKTTLLKILAGLILPDSGRALIAGQDILTKPSETREKVGFSPAEHNSFYGQLDGYENLLFFAALRGLDAKTLKNRLAILEQPLGLSEALRTPYQKASSGMKRRLSIARSLLHDPVVLLLDEPTQSLDPDSAGRLGTLIRDEFLRRERRLVLWSTQHPHEAWEIGTRIVILNAGKIMAHGTPADILRDAGASSPGEAYRFWSNRIPA